MNNISQISIFDYSEIENLGDLERLKIFFENLDDDNLCKKLEKTRKNSTDSCGKIHFFSSFFTDISRSQKPTQNYKKIPIYRAPLNQRIP